MSARPLGDPFLDRGGGETVKAQLLISVVPNWAGLAA
jgi:hypothetical protein